MLSGRHAEALNHIKQRSSVTLKFAVLASSQMPFSLPEAWPDTALGSLFAVDSGRRPTGSSDARGPSVWRVPRSRLLADLASVVFAFCSLRF